MFWVNLLKIGSSILRKGLSALRTIYDETGDIDKKKYNEHRQKVNDKSLIRYETLCERFFAGNENAFNEAVINYNHKILKIVKLTKRINVYDLEVPQTHNFALSSGIFVHNSAKGGRDRKYQAILPLFGKVLNTERARLDKIIESDKFKHLIIAVGAGIGEQFDVNKLRYHKIVIMTDADVDGSHIKCLYLTFFYRHLKDVLANGHIYVALPPLYKITSNKKSEYVYTEEEKNEYLQKLPGNTKVKVQRYKGLGEMNAEELWETTMDPKRRVLKQITIDDAEAADHMFNVLMGEDVPPRKKFIQTHAKSANLDI